MSENRFGFLGTRLGYHFGLTTPGWFFFLLMAFIMAAAVSSGHNLLYLSVCLFFGAFITMGNAAVMNLRGLEIDREVRGYLFAQTPLPVKIRLRNKRRLMDSFSLEVREVNSRGGKPLGKVLVPLVGKGKDVQREYQLVPPHRGWFDLVGLEINTRFPFGFWERSRGFERPVRLMVFPRIFEYWPGDPSHLAVDGDYIGKRLGTGDDLLNFRSFQPGDPIRWIHWKNSAKTDRLTVAVFHHPENRQIVICLRTIYDESLGRHLPEHFEEAVSWAATAVVKLLDRGISVGYMDESSRIPPAPGEGQKIHILTHLAFVNPASRGEASSRFGTDRVPIVDEYLSIEATATGVRIRTPEGERLFEEVRDG